MNKEAPIVWSIAGSDSSSGAGIQADIKACAAFGVHCSTAIAAITAQNSQAVTGTEVVSVSLLDAQLHALADDAPPKVIKTGMLGSVENLRVVCRWIDQLRQKGHLVKMVVDPVLGASTGRSFVDDSLKQAYLTELFPRAQVLTPNQREAQQLGLTSKKYGTYALVVTGGDEVNLQSSHDWISTQHYTGWLMAKRIDSLNHHGTGCTFSSSIASALALGYDVIDSIVLAKMATMEAIRQGYVIGQKEHREQNVGVVSAHHGFARNAENMPTFQPGADYSRRPYATMEDAIDFPRLRNAVLGVYAIVNSSELAAKALATGIRTIQLRIKNGNSFTLRDEIAKTVALAKDFPHTQIFINDHWELALELGAYGVHLGQEDLYAVDLSQLAKSGLRLGVSTHSYIEMASALQIRPSYVACGPVFATQSKVMPWIPQGLENLAYWSNLLSIPVVGIGGIDTANMKTVAQTGCSGAALIGAIQNAHHIHEVSKQLQEQWVAGHHSRTTQNLTVSIAQPTLDD